MAGLVTHQRCLVVGIILRKGGEERGRREGEEESREAEGCAGMIGLGKLTKVYMAIP